MAKLVPCLSSLMLLCACGSSLEKQAHVSDVVFPTSATSQLRNEFPAPSNPSSVKKKWTYMVFLNADNNLEEFGISDFLEMAKVGSNDDINIVVMLDRRDGYDTSHDNWTDTRIGLVNLNDKPDSKWGMSIGEQDMGSKDALSSFIEWTQKYYPSEKYATILWDHGDGWRSNEVTKGVSHDDTSSSYLRTRDVRTSLEKFAKMDLLGYDACLMGMLENLYELKDTTSTIVASEDTEPGDGWPYTPILTYLKGNPNSSSSDLGKIITQEYKKSYSTNNKVGLSTINSSRIDEFIIKLNTWADAVMTLNQTDIQPIRYAQASAPKMTYVDNMDFGSFLVTLANDSSFKFTDLTKELLNAYNKMHVSVDAYNPKFTGQAVYFPKSAISSDYNDNIRFAKNTKWLSMLKYISSNGTDIKPVNDNFANATVVNSLTSMNFTTTTATGEVGEPTQAGEINSVWYKFVIPKNGNFAVTTGPVDFDTVLYAFKGSDFSNLQNVAINDDASSGLISSKIELPDAKKGEIYYISIDGYSIATGSGAITFSSLDVGPEPTVFPTQVPTQIPTAVPTQIPTQIPTVVPTANPSPSNDNFTNATLVGIDVTYKGTTVGSSGESAEPTHSGETNSIWYKFVVPSNGNYKFTTKGSSLDTVLGLFQGSNVSALTKTAFNDDENYALGNFSTINMPNLKKDEVYFIAIDGYLSFKGSTQFKITKSN